MQEKLGFFQDAPIDPLAQGFGLVSTIPVGCADKHNTSPKIPHFLPIFANFSAKNTVIQQRFAQIMFPKYNVIVVGAGHAGCEAAVGAANLGAKVLLATMNMQTIAQMSCNPAMGGVQKGRTGAKFKRWVAIRAL